MLVDEKVGRYRRVSENAFNGTRVLQDECEGLRDGELHTATAILTVRSLVSSGTIFFGW
jgi:hypothetical protein